MRSGGLQGWLQGTSVKLRCAPSVVVGVFLVLVVASALAAGGPLGIDHRLSYDNSGIWKRSNQKALLALMVGTEIAGGLWEGGSTRLGRTFWESIDASAITGLSSVVLKHAFTRARPSQTDNPDLWFQGGPHYSFPSGEVAAVSAIVTPFVLEYRHDQPAVYALELLPIYDAVARVKVRGTGKVTFSRAWLWARSPDTTRIPEKVRSSCRCCRMDSLSVCVNNGDQLLQKDALWRRDYCC